MELSASLNVCIKNESALRSHRALKIQILRWFCIDNFYAAQNVQMFRISFMVNCIFLPMDRHSLLAFIRHSETHSMLTKGHGSAIIEVIPLLDWCARLLSTVDHSQHWLGTCQCQFNDNFPCILFKQPFVVLKHSTSKLSQKRNIFMTLFQQ